jgi:S1-C subfamily serine protease
VQGIAAKVAPGLVDVNSTFSYQGGQGAGTGIVLSSNGEVLTNNHVIDGATKVSVTDVGNGKTYNASVVGYDPTHDLAVLQLQGASGLQTAKLGDSSKSAVGDPVVAVGNAGGRGGAPSSTGGSITAVNQSITAGDEAGGSSEQLSGLIQVNANIQPGDSGGSLVNTSGDVIGVDTAASQGSSLTSSGTQGFAIPINQALATAKAIEAGHGSSDVHLGPTAFLGAELSPSNNPSGGFGRNQGGFDSTSASGAPLAGVVSGGPLAEAGLAAGDVITSINGTTIDSSSTLSSTLIQYHPGDKVQLGWVDSSGQSHTTTVTLAGGPPA